MMRTLLLAGVAALLLTPAAMAQSGSTSPGVSAPTQPRPATNVQEQASKTSGSENPGTPGNNIGAGQASAPAVSAPATRPGAAASAQPLPATNVQEQASKEFASESAGTPGNNISERRASAPADAPATRPGAVSETQPKPATNVQDQAAKTSGSENSGTPANGH